MSAKGHMVEAGVCPEVYPDALERGEVKRCTKTNRHWKHETPEEWRDSKTGKLKVGSIAWWGAPLSDEERAEVERIEAMGLGGVDPIKQAGWTIKLIGQLQGRL